MSDGGWRIGRWELQRGGFVAVVYRTADDEYDWRVVHRSRELVGGQTRDVWRVVHHERELAGGQARDPEQAKQEAEAALSEWQPTREQIIAESARVDCREVRPAKSAHSW